MLLFFCLSGGVLAQDYRQIDKETLLELTSRDSDTTYVLNFWATWCSPCVKELPHFEDLHQGIGTKKLKVVLVSLDFPRQAPERLPAFLEKHDISAPVLLMGDLDYNAWIDQVDPSWSGAIPATLIYKGNSRVFLEKVLSPEELHEHVKQIMK